MVGCQQDEIPYYSAEESALRFPGVIGGQQGDTLFRNYNNGLFSLWYSFVFNPGAEYADIEVPIILMGLPYAKDISINVSVMPHEGNAVAGQFDLIGGSIPAGKTKGNFTIRVKNAPELDNTTRQLHLSINATQDYKCGPEEYLHAVVYWNNEIVPPTVANQIRTYNMMIAGNANFIATTLTHYSPRAHKVVLAATGWEDMPLYTVVYAGNLYIGYARKVEAYIADYNAAHPSAPLLHDAGALDGQPIQARKY